MLDGNGSTVNHIRELMKNASGRYVERRGTLVEVEVELLVISFLLSEKNDILADIIGTIRNGQGAVDSMAKLLKFCTTYTQSIQVKLTV
jgi:hypothetical protein